jgi:hypothetical protein
VARRAPEGPCCRLIFSAPSYLPEMGTDMSVSPDDGCVRAATGA